MVTRRSAGRRPQLTFTSDFHELVQGDLIVGPCVLRYDPWRIVPPAEISGLATAQRTVTACVNQHPTGGLWKGELWFRPGVRAETVPDPAGQGGMLKAEFPINQGAEELEIWFTYTDNVGRPLWDSRMGRNFWLRFPTHDLEIEDAQVGESGTAGTDRFDLQIAAVPAVDAVALRWRLTHPTQTERRQVALQLTADSGRRIWKTPSEGVPVPAGSTLVFDVLYFAQGRLFTDDNEGTWYLPERRMGKVNPRLGSDRRRT
jgi:hypothetical protein